MEKIKQSDPILSRNIRRLRIARGMRSCDVICALQLREFAISSSTYSKIELGCGNVPVDMLVALADIFGCDFNAFFID